MIAVTGASGLVGGYIVEKLNTEKIPVKALSRKPQPSTTDVKWIEGDLNDLHALELLVKGADVVIHCAGFVSFTASEKKLNTINAIGTGHVVDTCLTFGIPLIYISSVAALEGQCHLSNYGHSKMLGEMEVYRGKEEGLEVAIVSPSIVFSPINKGGGRHVLKSLKQGLPFYFDGNINYVDARDVADLVFEIIKQKKYGDKWIAHAEALSWKNLLEEASQRLNTKKPDIKIPTILLQLGGVFSEAFAFITRQEAWLTYRTAKLATTFSTFDNSKTKELNFKFRTRKETLDWYLDKNHQ